MNRGGSIKEDVDRRIVSKKVYVISKRSCGYSAMAKDCFKRYLGKELPKDEYGVWEIDGEPSAVQTYLARLTGARTVPRVFINGKCIGGGTEVQVLDNNGQLKKMLQELFGTSSETGGRKQAHKK